MSLQKWQEETRFHLINSFQRRIIEPRTLRKGTKGFWVLLCPHHASTWSWGIPEAYYSQSWNHTSSGFFGGAIDYSGLFWGGGTHSSSTHQGNKSLLGNSVLNMKCALQFSQSRCVQVWGRQKEVCDSQVRYACDGSQWDRDASLWIEWLRSVFCYISKETDI